MARSIPARISLFGLARNYTRATFAPLRVWACIH